MLAPDIDLTMASVPRPSTTDPRRRVVRYAGVWSHFGVPAPHEADITTRFHSGQKSLKPHQKVTGTHWKIHHGANA
jgi:hypothetical protein